jgi:hypothetical protein
MDDGESDERWPSQLVHHRMKKGERTASEMHWPSVMSATALRKSRANLNEPMAGSQETE